MHEIHAWIGIAESTSENDIGNLADIIGDLRSLIEAKTWHDACFDLRNLNGQFFLTITAFVNRRREEAERVELLLSTISRRLPGSWGLVYERDDEMPTPPGPNGYRVRVLARGTIIERLDPFLSPCMPVIED